MTGKPSSQNPRENFPETPRDSSAPLRSAQNDRATTRVAAIQMACGTDPQANLEKAIARVREAAAQGAQIICLPELFRSQYFCQSEDHANFELAETIPGPSTDSLGEVARETGAVIVASLFEKRTAGLYHNTAAIIGTKGELMGRYRKMHIPDDPSYYEKFYFTPGRPRFSQLAHAARQHRRLRLLGSMVSRSRPPNDAARRRDSLLPDRDRLASERERKIRLRPAFCLGNDAA